MKQILTLIVLFTSVTIYAQVGIGTLSPDTSAALEISSTDAGLLISRMTEAQRLAIATPATGLLVYETDTTPGFWYFNGTIWTTFGADIDWTVVGPNMHNANSGNVGIGTTTPTALFHLENSSPSNTTLINDGFEDSSIAPFTTGGDANWLITTTAGEFNSGSVGAKSGDIRRDQTTWIETTVNITSQYGGTVSYAFKTDAEEDFDELHFYIDSIDQTSGVTNTTWSTSSYELTTGVHTLRWTFEKDDSTNEGSDEVYLDDILIVENSIEGIFRLVDGNQGDGRVLMSDATGNAIWRDRSNVADDDWHFHTSFETSITDDLYRTGKVTIGNDRKSVHTLDVDNGSQSGTQIGLGSVEYLEDGLSYTLFSDSVAPIRDARFDLGSATNRWDQIYAVNGVINTSDARLKDNIVDLNYGIKEIMKLKPVSYTWKNEQYGNTIVPKDQKEVKLGFLAQDLQEVIGEVVQTHNWVPESEENHDTFVLKENERLGVNYTEMIPVLVKAIQEQQIEINKLKAIINKQ